MSAVDEALDPRTGGVRFSDLYARHRDAIVAYLMRRTGDAETAVDLMAETFAQAFLGRSRFRGETPEQAEAWLFGIARNLLRRYVRRGAAERRAIERLGIDVPSLEPSDYARIEELADLEDLRAAASNGMAGLPPKQREAVVLRVVEELSYEELAERLTVSEQTARARVSRGLRALAQSLDEKGAGTHG